MKIIKELSNKAINLKAASALHFAHYNFCRIHQRLKCSPAMEVEITKRLWNLEDLLDFELSCLDRNINTNHIIVAQKLAIDRHIYSCYIYAHERS